MASIPAERTAFVSESIPIPSTNLIRRHSYLCHFDIHKPSLEGNEYVENSSISKGLRSLDHMRNRRMFHFNNKNPFFRSF